MPLQQLLLLRYIENEKEKIKSQFVPPPEPEKKKVRRGTTTVPFPQEQTDSGEERSVSQQQRKNAPQVLRMPLQKQGRGVSEQIQPGRVLSPPEMERSVQEREYPRSEGVYLTGEERYLMALILLPHLKKTQLRMKR